MTIKKEKNSNSSPKTNKKTSPVKAPVPNLHYTLPQEVTIHVSVARSRTILHACMSRRNLCSCLNNFENWQTKNKSHIFRWQATIQHYRFRYNYHRSSQPRSPMLLKCQIHDCQWNLHTSEKRDRSRWRRDEWREQLCDYESNDKMEKYLHRINRCKKKRRNTHPHTFQSTHECFWHTLDEIAKTLFVLHFCWFFPSSLLRETNVYDEIEIKRTCHSILKSVFMWILHNLYDVVVTKSNKFAKFTTQFDEMHFACHSHAIKFNKLCIVITFFLFLQDELESWIDNLFYKQWKSMKKLK